MPVEFAVGAHLINGSVGTPVRVHCWREASGEVDVILRKGKWTTAIEVKSGRRRDSHSDITRFGELHRLQRKLLVGTHGVPRAEFFRSPPFSVGEVVSRFTVCPK